MKAHGDGFDFPKVTPSSISLDPICIISSDDLD